MDFSDLYHSEETPQPTRPMPTVDSGSEPPRQRRRRSERGTELEKLFQDEQPKETQVNDGYTVPPQGIPGNLNPMETPKTTASPVQRAVSDPRYQEAPGLNTPDMAFDRPSNAAPIRRSGGRDSVQEEEKEGGSGVLVAIIMVLLVIAALIIGLIMIPEDDTSLLGDVKRAVTEPIRRLLSPEEEEPVPGASGFTATVAQATSPYKVVFSIVTSDSVTAVRVVDEAGQVMPTVTTMSSPNTDTTLVWMFEMTLQNAYEGVVSAQVQLPGGWTDTGLTQKLTVGSNAVSTVSGMPGILSPVADLEKQGGLPTESATTEKPVETTPPAVATTEAVTPPPTATPTEKASPTPTLSMTATPTMMTTATPTLEPTATPTEVPTPTPTLEPTATPTATPVVTPKLEAVAVNDAAAELIAVHNVYSGGKKVTSYEREKPINMLPADKYLPQEFGVTTYRQSAFRQNAASGTVTGPTAMSLKWTVEAGSAQGESRNYYGIGWTGQPLIVKWNRDVRAGMNISDELKATVLKEVIVAGYDGRIYFLNLEDGTATRDVIDLGYPMRGTPTLSTIGYPLMTVGQYARKMKTGTSDTIGLYYYDMLNQKRVRTIDGLDKKQERLYYEVGAFDTSALMDRETNTLIAIGTNGMLYTEKLDLKLSYNTDGEIEFTFNEPEQVTLVSRTKNQQAKYTAVESSLAMYGSYAYYADMDGILRCVDTTMMSTIWAVDTGDAVRAAIALDLDEETGNLWLYTANTIRNNRTRGDVTIRRFNAMTGEEDWAFAIACAEGKKKDVTFNDIVVPGAIASPVVGRKGLNGLVYFTLSSVSKTGAQKLVAADKAAAMDGVLIALDKATGEVVWHKVMDAYCYSSPVAVYDEAGRGWIIQACSNGTLYLMDGLTGEVINTLQVNGVIEGSPAVYYNTLVIGTTGKDKSYIYGIALN